MSSFIITFVSFATSPSHLHLHGICCSHTCTCELITCVFHINTISPPRVVPQLQKPNKDFSPVSFGVHENTKTEYVTFDVVELYYPYNAIFGRGFANKFNAAIHMVYLCMKIPALHRIITVQGSQKEARNIKRAIYKS